MGLRLRALTALVCVLLPAGVTFGATELSARINARNSVTAGELKEHVAALADDTFEGRAAGTRGGRAAAGYIIERLRTYGLHGGAEEGSFTQALDGQQRNLLAIIPGSDPDVRHEIILIGAHYDHVGYGTKSNSYGPLGYIHNGADDNASGVATVLEAAQALAALNGSMRRTVLIAFWDGEEQGLIGSTHWIRNPTITRANLKCAVNLDMVGRLRSDKLEVFGTRTTYGMRKLLSQSNVNEQLSLQFLWQMSEDSDHFPFYYRNIPSLMFHTGKHPDYHRPSDDADKINTDGMQRIARLLVEFVIGLADSDAAPEFRQRCRSEGRDEQGRESFERPLPPDVSRFAVRWRADQSAENGVVLSEVSRNTPAWKAELRTGDRITSWNDVPVTAYEQFQRLMSTTPETAKLSVVPWGQKTPREVTIRLDGAPVRIGIGWVRDDAEPEAAVVKRTYPASPAASAGLQPGDRIYSVDNLSFKTDAEFETLLHAARGKVELSVERHGMLRTAVLDLGDGPSPTDY